MRVSEPLGSGGDWRSVSVEWREDGSVYFENADFGESNHLGDGILVPDGAALLRWLVANRPPLDAPPVDEPSDSARLLCHLVRERCHGDGLWSQCLALVTSSGVEFEEGWFPWSAPSEEDVTAVAARLRALGFEVDDMPDPDPQPEPNGPRPPDLN